MIHNINENMLYYKNLSCQIFHLSFIIKIIILGNMNRTKHITTAALIGAVYAALTVFLAPISYGPVQVRIAEALTVLPYLMPEAIWGLWIGCMVANLYSGFGPLDIFGGSFITLLAAITTFYMRRFNRPVLAPLPPVVLNAFGVSAYLSFLVSAPNITILGLDNFSPYFLFVITIGFGELIACYGLGFPLLLLFIKRYDFNLKDRQNEK